MSPDDQLSPHFKRGEFACHNNCGFMEPSMELVSGLEELRSLINASLSAGAKERAIIVDDGCRCAIHNKEVGGAPNSQHLTGSAADITVEGMAAMELYSYANKVQAFNGFGVSVADYIHVDIREYPARWRYDATGKEVKWFNGDSNQSSIPT